MKIDKLKSPEINQNGYHKNTLTKERIGALFVYPIDFTPDDCLSCDGYSLLIADYEELHKVIGTKFNQTNDDEGTFRIPDYNITGRFLQPGANVGNQIEAGLPNISGGTSGGSYGACRSSNNNTPSAWGAFYGTLSRGLSGENTNYGMHLNFEASRSNAIYGASTTVQPPSQIVHVCIKYK